LERKEEGKSMVGEKGGLRRRDKSAKELSQGISLGEVWQRKGEKGH